MLLYDLEQCLTLLHEKKLNLNNNIVWQLIYKKDKK